MSRSFIQSCSFPMWPMMRFAFLLLSLWPLWSCSAQGVVPFVSTADEFIIFDNGRFERVEPRPPRQFHRIGGRVLYVDHDGRLKLYTVRGTRVAILEEDIVEDLACSATLAAWRSGDRLMVLQGHRALLVAQGAGHFTVSDSLVVYHDMGQRELKVRWRGGDHVLAALGSASVRPQWAAGANTVTFFDKEQRTIHVFHRGRVRVLCEGTDAARVAPGMDMVAYVHGDSNELRLFNTVGDRRISNLPALRFVTGRGLVGFVDHGGRLMAHRSGITAQVADSIPGLWEVRDSLLVFIHGGGLWMLGDAGAQQVVPYVPEQWEVAGGTIHYLDLDRRLWSMHGEQRKRSVRDRTVRSFALHGDAILLRDMDLRPVVLWNGRVYAF